jgi:hypothetical protein
MRKYWCLGTLGILLILYLTAISCRNQKRNGLYPEIDDSSIANGEILAKRHCQSCHMLPDPSWLDAHTWEDGVLPAMGPFLGIYQHGFQKYSSGRRDPNLDRKIYPDQPVMNADGWQFILDYYRCTAPDSLIQPTDQILPVDGIPGFEVIGHTFTVNPPTTSLVKITEGKDVRRLWVTDLFTEKVYCFDSTLQLTDSLQTQKAIVDLVFHENGISFCDIGEINPNNRKLGTVGELIYKNNQLLGIDTITQLKTLARPVQVTRVDVDLDHQPDYIVNEFGFLTGSLTLYRKNGNEFERKVIKDMPGATKVYLRDYNGDGLPDIYALFAQGNEGIFLFTNQGGGNFSEKQLLQFPPVYGSTFFEMIDLNGDEKLDIVYTCGDNADYSRVLKPYHGLYIYLNNGDDTYRQTFFYHMNGCYKAIARDFDHDGNADIAAISFFADYARFPDEGFVYLHNKGNFLFQPYTITEARGGRWITMDAGDLNGDGKLDLVLGNFSYGPVMMQPQVDWSRGNSFLFLKNIGRKN